MLRQELVAHSALLKFEDAARQSEQIWALCLPEILGTNYWQVPLWGSLKTPRQICLPPVASRAALYNLTSACLEYICYYILDCCLRLEGPGCGFISAFAESIAPWRLKAVQFHLQQSQEAAVMRLLQNLSCPVTTSITLDARISRRAEITLRQALSELHTSGLNQGKNTISSYSLAAKSSSLDSVSRIPNLVIIVCNLSRLHTGNTIWYMLYSFHMSGLSWINLHQLVALLTSETWKRSFCLVNRRADCIPILYEAHLSTRQKRTSYDAFMTADLWNWHARWFGKSAVTHGEASRHSNRFGLFFSSLWTSSFLLPSDETPMLESSC